MLISQHSFCIPRSSRQGNCCFLSFSATAEKHITHKRILKPPNYVGLIFSTCCVSPCCGSRPKFSLGSLLFEKLPDLLVLLTLGHLMSVFVEL